MFFPFFVTAAPGDEAVPQRVKNYQAVFSAPPKRVPTDTVVDGPLMGNGDLGVTLGGPPEALTFYLSKNDFWRATSRYPQGSPKPIGTLKISSASLKGAAYHVLQRLWEADLLGEFSTGERTLRFRSWTPATNNCLVVELSNEGPPLDLDLSLDPAKGDGGTTSSGQNVITRSFTDNVEWPSCAAIAMGNDGLPAPATHVHMRLESGKPRSVVLCVRTNHDSPDFVGAATQAVQHTDLSKLAKAQRRWWTSFWQKSAIQIDDPLIEKFWYGSLYLMAMCSRNRSYPPGLFGNWITSDAPAWAGDYHLNYNYQAPWWGVFSSNHVELAQPYDKPLWEAISRGRENARKLLGMPGVYLEIGIGPRGLLTCKSPDYDLFWGQKSDAVYATVNMLMRWRTTRDRHYIKSVAYPFLREVAAFWESYLVLEDGRYVVKSDAIHEGSGNDKNPILTLGLLRNLFQGMIHASQALGLDAESRHKWQDILDKLSPFPTQERNGKTVFRYTESGMAWNDSNSLGIQHIYPAGAIDLGSSPELLEVSRNTIEEMHRWDDYNAFPTFYTAAVRVGINPETILGHLREQLQKHGFPKLFVYYGGGGIECCSAVPSCIDEMLMQSHEGVIWLFPGWPKGKDARFWNLRADGAFVVSATLKDGIVRDVSLVSEKGEHCALLSPWSKPPVITETLGTRTKTLAVSAKSGILSFATKPKATYRFSE